MVDYIDRLMLINHLVYSRMWDRRDEALKVNQEDRFLNCVINSDEFGEMLLK